VVAREVRGVNRHQYRLRLTYHRNNKARVSKSQTFSEAGDQADEVVTMDAFANSTTQVGRLQFTIQLGTKTDAEKWQALSGSGLRQQRR
jgi:hypothetical protein